MKTLGMIGGMSWISTVDYYRGINELVNARAGGSHYPQLALYSLDFGAFKEIIARQDWDAFLELTTQVGGHLRVMGADGLIMCCNTGHIVADRLQDRLGIPLINIADATARAIRGAGVTRVALLGTRLTMESSFFRERLERSGISCVIPAADDRTFMHSSILEELGRGIFRDETKQRYVRVLRDFEKAGAQGAVLGCTELPLLIKADDVDFPLFDTTALHVAAAAEFILT